MLHSTYQDVIDALAAAGRFTSFRKNVEGGLLTCVANKTKDGILDGTSFILVLRNRHWYITSWGADRVYRIPESEDAVAVSLDWLENYRVSNAVPSEIIEKYQLEIISEFEKKTVVGF